MPKIQNPPGLTDSSSLLPPDPFDLKIGDEIVEFYHYQGYEYPIPMSQWDPLLTKAMTNSRNHRYSEPIGTDPVDVRSHGLQLILIPREEMTWRNYGNFIATLWTAMYAHDLNCEWSFHVAMDIEPSLGHEIGYGQLRRLDMPATGTSKA